MRVLVGVVDAARGRTLTRLARAIAGADEVHLVALLSPGPDEQLIDVQPRARARRRELEAMVGDDDAMRTSVIGAGSTWEALSAVVHRERSELLLLGWEDVISGALGVGEARVLGDPPCAVVIARGDLADAARVLVPVRGGSGASLAARVGSAVAHANGGRATVLHVIEPGDRPEGPVNEHLVAAGSVDVRRDRVMTLLGNPEAVILDELPHHDAIVFGATGRDVEDPLGPVGRPVFEQAKAAAVVRTRTPVVSSIFLPRPTPPRDRRERSRAIGEVVDRWFVANTFASAEFANLRRLVQTKERQGLRISVGLPALNEEATIGPIIRSIRSRLMTRYPLVDELVLIDSRSTDRTREIAAAEGVPVQIHDEILPEMGTRVGKGEALWKSLHVLTGDIVVWVDTDVSNFHPRFVYGILGPLLLRPEISFVKAFYRRPLRMGGEIAEMGGGRVTELTARPLFNLFFPELSGLVQPLSGEQGGHRRLLEQVPFFTGYGVETGLLIDILRRAGLGAIAQVDMKRRFHRNQTLYSLAQMAFRIVQVVTKRVGEAVGQQLWEEANATMKLISEGEKGTLRLKVQDIEVEERPPMVTVPAYRAARERLPEGTDEVTPPVPARGRRRRSRGLRQRTSGGAAGD